MGAGASIVKDKNGEEYKTAEDAIKRGGYTQKQIDAYLNGLAKLEKELGDFEWEADVVTNLLFKAATASSLPKDQCDQLRGENVDEEKWVSSHGKNFADALMATDTPTSQLVDAECRKVAQAIKLGGEAEHLFAKEFHRFLGEKVAVWEEDELEAEKDIGEFVWEVGTIQELITTAATNAKLGEDKIAALKDKSHAEGLTGQMTSRASADAAIKKIAAAVGLDAEGAGKFAHELHGCIGEKIEDWEDAEDDAENAEEDIGDFTWDAETVKGLIVSAVDVALVDKKKSDPNIGNTLSAKADEIVAGMKSKGAVEEAMRKVAKEVNLTDVETDDFCAELHRCIGEKIEDWEDEEEEETKEE